VYPPAVALHLARAAERKGATLLLGRTVCEMANGTVRLDDGTEIHAPRLVNATGAWSPALTPELSVRKRKGHLVITDRYPGVIRHQLVELGYLKSAHSVATDSVAFNVQPRKTGQILIGSSRQYGNESTEVDQEILTAMLQRATQYIPALAALSAIRVWTGFRAATPDNLPLIGPSTFDKSIWLATGHEGLGITTALGTAALLVSEFTGSEPMIPHEPYLPGRSAQATSHSDFPQKEPSWNGKA
jgi:glycine/D-amino acid oxidase-like deaminating enzyme